MRKLAIALLLGFIFLGKNAADGLVPLAPATGPRVLYLVDIEGPGTAALEAALGTAGFQVTHFPAPEYNWDNTGIYALSNFDVVIHLNGYTYAVGLPVPSQTALETFVQSGGGYVGGQWNGFEQDGPGYQSNMPNLTLQSWPQGYEEVAVTYTVVPAQAGHPVLAGLPPSFGFFADGVSDGPTILFGVNPSTALMTSSLGNDGVLVRPFGSGRVVNFSLAPNYDSISGPTNLTLQDSNIQRLYVNAVNWSASPFARLIAAVNALPAPPMDARTRATLLDLVYRARERAGAGRPDSAIVLLRSFIASVGKFSPSKLSAPNAANLITLANAAIGSLAP